MKGLNKSFKNKTLLVINVSGNLKFYNIKISDLSKAQKDVD